MESNGRERYSVLLGMKVSRDLAAEIRRKAREDERPVSAYLRRIVADVVTRESANAEAKA